jgi:hypothetical protein
MTRRALSNGGWLQLVADVPSESRMDVLLRLRQELQAVMAAVEELERPAFRSRLATRRRVEFVVLRRLW